MSAIPGRREAASPKSIAADLQEDALAVENVIRRGVPAGRISSTRNG
jgi:hypothetical protein